MSKKLFSMIALAAIVAGLVLSMSPAVTHAKGKNKAGRVEGTLTALDTVAMTASITQHNGTVVTVSITATTKIERNEHHARLSALHIGDRAEARFSPATMIATKLESVGP